MNRLPNLLIVGTQKSGTSWTHMALSHSKYIFASKIKELCFFGKKNCLKPEQIEEYKENFIEGRELYYLESTPHYFRLPSSNGFCRAENMRAILPDNIKLIVIFRNPVERALSATVHNIFAGRIPYTELISKVYRENFIVEFGFYYQILKYWKSIFGDQLEFFFYDEMEKNPIIFINSIFTFLDISENLPDSVFLKRKNDKKQRAKKI